MRNPYLKEERLADVIAAITALGTYKFYKLDLDGWATRISANRKTGAHWHSVFVDHPEFFRITSDDQKASLVWRRQFARNFDVDTESEVLPDHQITGQQYDRISRRPLTSNEISTLVSVAIDLHERAIEQQNSKRWWIPLLIGALAFVGSLLGAWLSK